MIKASCFKKSPKHNSKCKQFLTTGQKTIGFQWQLTSNLISFCDLLHATTGLKKHYDMPYFYAFHCSIKIKCYKDLYTGHLL